MAALTPKQSKWIDEYLHDFNATRAARASGYSEGTARQIGSQNLSKLNIQEEIAKRLDALGMTAPEITKRFTDLARGNMSDYMIIKQVPHTPQIKVGLNQLILNEKEHILREEEFCDRKGLTEDVYDKFQEGLDVSRDKILRWEIELEYNPGAFRIVDGETIMLEVAELDLVKVMEDKERGIIKSVKHTKDGVQVELYNADAALGQLAKIRGMLIDKSEIDLNANVETVTRIGYGNKKLD